MKSCIPSDFRPLLWACYVSIAIGVLWAIPRNAQAQVYVIDQVGKSVYQYDLTTGQATGAPLIPALNDPDALALSSLPILEEETRFYQTLFNASVEQTFPHFKNIGFTRSAGFLEDPQSVDGSIRFLKIAQWEFEEGHADIGSV